MLKRLETQYLSCGQDMNPVEFTLELITVDIQHAMEEPASEVRSPRPHRDLEHKAARSV